MFKTLKTSAETRLTTSNYLAKLIGTALCACYMGLTTVIKRDSCSYCFCTIIAFISFLSARYLSVCTSYICQLHAINKDVMLRHVRLIQIQETEESNADTTLTLVWGGFRDAVDRGLIGVYALDTCGTLRLRRRLCRYFGVRHLAKFFFSLPVHVDGSAFGVWNSHQYSVERGRGGGGLQGSLCPLETFGSREIVEICCCRKIVVHENSKFGAENQHLNEIWEQNRNFEQSWSPLSELFAPRTF